MFVLLTHHEEVDILERCRRLCNTLYLAINRASFQVEDVVQVVWLFQPQRVLHQHDVHVVDFVRFDSEDAEYLREEAIWH